MRWKQGTPDDWAMEAFNIAYDDAYGGPPLPKDAPQRLDERRCAVRHWVTAG
jgi:hypothetical protein